MDKKTFFFIAFATILATLSLINVFYLKLSISMIDNKNESKGDVVVDKHNENNEVVSKSESEVKGESGSENKKEKVVDEDRYFINIYIMLCCVVWYLL